MRVCAVHTQPAAAGDAARTHEYNVQRTEKEGAEAGEDDDEEEVLSRGVIVVEQVCPATCAVLHAFDDNHNTLVGEGTNF